MECNSYQIRKAIDYNLFKKVGDCSMKHLGIDLVPLHKDISFQWFLMIGCIIMVSIFIKLIAK
jgi:hypothetical protein